MSFRENSFERPAGIGSLRRPLRATAMSSWLTEFPLTEKGERLMQNQNWRLFNRVIVVAAVTLLVMSFATFAAAQGGDAVHAMYAAAPKEATNIKGVSIIADRPKGFNPLTASSQELGRYGLPPRPDPQANPKGYARWA